jgi:23S rRNA pseudouridine1911/1915/1917 synthase
VRVRHTSGLLDFLFGEFPQVSRTRVKKWLRLRCVSVNGKAVTKHDCVLSPGDEIRVEPGKKTPLALKSSPKILYEDEHILVVEKPAGLLTVATEKVKTKTVYFELNEWLRSVNPKRPQRVFIVHRLDRETSGLLVFAKNETAKHKLQKNWDKSEKCYTAIVEGVPRSKEETLKSRLAQNKTLKVYSIQDDDQTAKLAVTHYRMLKTNGKFSLLDVFPRTGRKNQIRVQLADIGNPVTGDKKYGAKENPAGRLALHARELSFKHPATDQPMTFHSEVPKELTRILK